MTTPCPECGAKPNQSHLAACRRYNALLSDLGTASDATIARRYGISHTHVQRLRRQHKIPPFSPVVPRLPGADLTRPVNELAWERGVTPQAVRRARLRAGIRMAPERAAPPADLVTSLGQETDAALAARYGLTESAVRRMRRTRGIARLPRSQAQKPPKKEAGAEIWEGVNWLLTDKQIGRIVGRAPRTVCYARHKWAPRLEQGPAIHPRLVGVDLARDIGEIRRECKVSRNAIVRARRLVGVYVAPVPPPVIPVDKLGTMPDTDLARLCGCSDSMIQKRRKALGVPPFMPQGTAGGFQKRRAGTRPVIALGAQAPIGGKREASDNVRLRDRLRGRQEEEPTGPIRREMITPTEIDTAGMSTREKAIVRAVRVGKPWEWIEREYRTTREEVGELGV